MAQISWELGATETALISVRGVIDDGCNVRRLYLQLARWLIRSGASRDAASILDKASILFPGDYEITFERAGAWAMAAEIQKATGIYQGLLDHPKAGVEVFVNLSHCLLQTGDKDPGMASQAFDLLAKALTTDPTDATLPARIHTAGLASGRESEAWKLIGPIDLTNNPHIRQVNVGEMVSLIKDHAKVLAEVSELYESGLVPFDVLAANIPRPNWFVWWSRMAEYHRHLTSNTDATRRTLVNLPTMGSVGRRESISPGGLLFDKTSLLTIGCLQSAREVFESVAESNIAAYVGSDTVGWLQQEITELRADQLPAYRARFKDVLDSLQSSNKVRKAAHQALCSTDDKDGDQRDFINGVLQEVSVGAYYLDDYPDESLAQHVSVNDTFTSPKLLVCLNNCGLLLQSELNDILPRLPETMHVADPGSTIDVGRPFVVGHHTLLFLHAVGLLEKWLNGDDEWPEIIVLPESIGFLRYSARETQLYRETLDRAEKTHDSVIAALEAGHLYELPVGIVDTGALTAYSAMWNGATATYAQAKDAALTLIADDLFLLTANSHRGLLTDERALRQSGANIQTQYGDVPVMGTTDLLAYLSKAEMISEARAGRLTWDLMENGYAYSDVRLALRWLLNEVPYSHKSPATQYRRLFQYLESIPANVPFSDNSIRNKDGAQRAAISIAQELIVEVWSTRASIAASHDREALASAILSALERALSR